VECEHDPCICEDLVDSDGELADVAVEDDLPTGPGFNPQVWPPIQEPVFNEAKKRERPLPGKAPRVIDLVSSESSDSDDFGNQLNPDLGAYFAQTTIRANMLAQIGVCASYATYLRALLKANNAQVRKDPQITKRKK